jgi:hypothetical protein
MVLLGKTHRYFVRIGVRFPHLEQTGARLYRHRKARRVPDVFLVYVLAPKGVGPDGSFTLHPVWTDS